MNQLVPLTKPDQLVAVGTPFDTTHKARWAERMSRDNQNGLKGAFVRIGKNVFLDVGRFHELVRQQVAGCDGGAK